MIFNFPTLPDFFQNREFNQFYLAVFIITFGETLVSIFVPIYLFNLGYAVHQIIFFFFLMSVYFLILSYPAAQVVSRIGVKRSILLSGPFLVLYLLGPHICEYKLGCFFAIAANFVVKKHFV